MAASDNVILRGLSYNFLEMYIGITESKKS